MKKVKFYNCFCNEILVSTFLFYPLRLHVVKVEKKSLWTWKKSQKVTNISFFFLHSVSLQQFISNFVPKHQIVEGESRPSTPSWQSPGKLQKKYILKYGNSAILSALPEQLWFSSQWRRPQVLNKPRGSGRSISWWAAPKAEVFH